MSKEIEIRAVVRVLARVLGIQGVFIESAEFAEDGE